MDKNKSCAKDLELLLSTCSRGVLDISSHNSKPTRVYYVLFRHLLLQWLAKVSEPAELSFIGYGCTTRIGNSR